MFDLSILFPIYSSKGVHPRDYLLAQRLQPFPAIGGFTAQKVVFLASLQNSFVEGILPSSRSSLLKANVKVFL